MSEERDVDNGMNAYVRYRLEKAQEVIKLHVFSMMRLNGIRLSIGCIMLVSIPQVLCCCINICLLNLILGS